MTLKDLINAAQHLTWQEQLQLATRLLQWASAKMPGLSASQTTDRQPDLHSGAFVMQDDFDAPLSDAFWLGEE